MAATLLTRDALADGAWALPCDVDSWSDVVTVSDAAAAPMVVEEHVVFGGAVAACAVSGDCGGFALASQWSLGEALLWDADLVRAALRVCVRCPPSRGLRRRRACVCGDPFRSCARRVS
jgi:hypothetical protein